VDLNSLPWAGVYLVWEYALLSFDTLRMGLVVDNVSVSVTNMRACHCQSTISCNLRR